MGEKKLDKGLPSELREQLAEWRLAYCPENQPEPSRHRSVLVPVVPSSYLLEVGVLLAGPCSFCNDCGFSRPVDEKCSQCGSNGGAAEEEAQAMAGRLLGGKWKLIERVGVGSFGTFWRGEHHILGMRVGIKILRRHLTATPAGLKLFHAEAMRVSLLNHPGIVKLFDYGEDDGVPYLVMEYLSGKPLNEFPSGRLALEDYIEIVCQATKALISAHKGTFTDGQPLAHLDLKPEHIFIECFPSPGARRSIEGSWHVKVIDFGLAEITAGPGSDAPGATGGNERRRVAGTPPYMGPERFQGVVDPRSDLYSLGVILYQCVAGRLPFECGDMEEYRTAHEKAVPVPPSRHVGRSASRSLKKLDRLILRTLSKDLRDRPRSAEEFLEALEAWKRVRTAETESRRWSSRARRWTASALACAVPVLFILWVSPGGRVELDGGVPALLWLSASPKETVGSVLGIAYVDAPVVLEFELSDGRRQVPLATVERDGRFKCKWPGGELLTEKLGKDRVAHGKKYSAAVVASRLGRSVRTPSFTVEFDYERPIFRTIEDDGGTALKTRTEAESGHPITTFILPAARCSLRLRPSEPLDLESCLIGDEPPLAGVACGDTIPFEFNGDRESLDYVLVDRAGNEVRGLLHLRPERKVWFLEPGVEELRTSADEVSLTVAGVGTRLRVIEDPVVVVFLQGDLGLLQVLVDGRLELESRESKAELRVQLSGAPCQTRQVVLRAWSVLTDPSARPDAERTLTVKKLKRDIEIDALREGKGIPRLRVLDGSSQEEVPDARIEGTVRQKDGSPEEVRCDHGAFVPPSHMRGMLQCIFTATDSFGNISKPLALEIVHPAPPVISSLAIVGDLGTQDRPLHSAQCSCRPLEAEGRDQPFALEAVLDYGHLDDLKAEIQRIDADGTISPLRFTRRGDRFEIRQSDLLRVLEKGSNILELSVFDSRDPDTPPNLRASRHVVIHVASVDLTIYPPSGLAPLNASGMVDLRINAGGARMERVLVNGEPVKPQNGPEGEYAYDLPVPVEHHGETLVTVEAQADGRSHKVERKYHRLPAEGIDYVFRVEPRMKLPALKLRFRRTSAEGQAFRGFWYSEVELGEKLVRDEKPQEGSPPAGGGVTWAQAERVLRRLEKELREAGWIQPAEQVKQVRLPTRSELEKIRDPTPRREWLEPETNELEDGPWTALWAKVSDKGITTGGADGNETKQRAAFRIVMEYGVTGSRLTPFEAQAR